MSTERSHEIQVVGPAVVVVAGDVAVVAPMVVPGSCEKCPRC